MPFPINTKVMHNVWGPGLVLRYEGDKMVVLFESVGYKTLAVDVVVEHHLLTPVKKSKQGRPLRSPLLAFLYGS